MDGQISLFDMGYFSGESWKRDVSSVLDDIASREELLEKSIFLKDNINKDGKLTSYSICLYEPDYPPLQEGVHGGQSIVTFKEDGDSFIFSLPDIKEMALPEGVECLKSSARVLKDSPLFLDLVRFVVDYRIRHYKSASKFSCCSRFLECSDKKKCIHPNRLYATGCEYRKNLESGRIFFGKNRNIS